MRIRTKKLFTINHRHYSAYNLSEIVIAQQIYIVSTANIKASKKKIRLLSEIIAVIMRQFIFMCLILGDVTHSSKNIIRYMKFLFLCPI